MHAQMDMMLRQRRLSEDGIIAACVYEQRAPKKIWVYQVPAEKNLYGHFSQLATLPQKLYSNFY